MRAQTLSVLINLIFALLLMKNIYCDDQTVHHRVRRFVFAKNSKVAFDIDLSVPVPSLNGVDVRMDMSFPLSITMLNDTLIFNPITIPMVVLPEAPANSLNFPSFMPNYYSYDSYFGTPGGNPFFNTHQAMKRSIGAASAQHRYDLFNSIGEVLERFGIDGRTCIYRAICESAHTPMLIESPLHEILEHILMVSRSFDEEGILQDYIEAENYGKDGKDCSRKYSSCAFSIFTKLLD